MVNRRFDPNEHQQQHQPGEGRGAGGHRAHSIAAETTIMTKPAVPRRCSPRRAALSHLAMPVVPATACLG